MKPITFFNIAIILVLTSCSPATTALPTLLPTVIPTNTAIAFATPTQIPFDQVPFEYVSFSEPEKLWSENAGGISLEDHYLYVKDLASQTLFAYDLLTDPQLTTPIFRIDYNTPLFFFDVHKDIIYAGFQTSFQSYSIADPSNLVSLQKYSYEISLSYQQILATEDFVYVNDRRGKLDIRTTDGKLISRFNFSHPDYDAILSPVHYSNGYLYVVVSRTTITEPHQMEQSFRIYKRDDFNNLSLVSSFALPNLDFNVAPIIKYTINTRDNYVFLTWWVSQFAFIQEFTDKILGEVIVLDIGNPNHIKVVTRGQASEAAYDAILVDNYLFVLTELGIRTHNFQEIYYPYESTRKDLYQIEYKGRASQGNIVNFNNTIYVSTSEYELYRIEYTIQK